MDSCLNSKSAYIFERRYEDLPSGYYDYDVLKYWEKMIGQEAISSSRKHTANKLMNCYFSTISLIKIIRIPSRSSKLMK